MATTLTKRRRGRGSAVDHYDYYWLRCPSCNGRNELTLPVDSDERPDFSVKPLLGCSKCDWVGPTVGYRRTWRLHRVENSW